MGIHLNQLLSLGKEPDDCDSVFTVDCWTTFTKQCAALLSTYHQVCLEYGDPCLPLLWKDYGKLIFKSLVYLIVFAGLFIGLKSHTFSLQDNVQWFIQVHWGLCLMYTTFCNKKEVQGAVGWEQTNIHSVSTLLGTPVHQLVNGNIESAKHVAATKCIQACRSGKEVQLFFRNVIEVTLIMEWLFMPDRVVWVYQRLPISWDFHAQQYLASKKVLLLREVREEGLDW